MLFLLGLAYNPKPLFFHQLVMLLFLLGLAYNPKPLFFHQLAMLLFLLGLAYNPKPLFFHQLVMFLFLLGLAYNPKPLPSPRPVPPTQSGSIHCTEAATVTFLRLTLRAASRSTAVCPGSVQVAQIASMEKSMRRLRSSAEYMLAAGSPPFLFALLSGFVSPYATRRDSRCCRSPSRRARGIVSLRSF